MNDKLTEFLRESNYIEREYSEEALKDALVAWNFIIKYAPLTIELICQIHNVLMINRPLEDRYKGRIRDCDVWIAGEKGLTPALIGRELRLWARKASVLSKTEEEIKVDHVAFERIHPFADGNGRIGRILMNWQRLRSDLPILVIKESEKHDYYAWFEEER